MRSHAFIDPQRIRRPHEGRTIEWPCSLRVRMRFRELLARLVDLEAASQRSPEVRAEMESLRDEIRSLPGYPARYDPEHDLIVPVTTTAMR